MNNNKSRVGKFFAFAAGALLLFSACSLDRDPISSASELTEGKQTDSTTAVLRDKAAAEAQLVELHSAFRGGWEKFNLDYLNLGDTHADNSYAGTTGQETIPMEINTLDPSNGDMGRDWSHYLWHIADANVLINGVDPLHDKGELNDTEWHQLKAQGMIYRAFNMFRMARMWGSFPVITQIAKTITSKNIEEVYPTYFPKRSTPEECYQQIISDLEYAEQYAPDLDPNDKQLFSKTVAQALLCKVYAEKPVQDYDKVIEYAEKVRNTTGIALEPDYATLWGWDEKKHDCVKRNTTEGILEMQHPAGQLCWVSFMYGRGLDDPDNNFTWAKWITPSRDLIRDFTQEGDTVRLNQSVVYYSCGWSNYYPSNHYAFMYKMRSQYQNIYYLRLADIILLEAEAYAYKGELQQSAQLVNMIRHRAKLPDLTSAKTATKEAMIDAVLHERRLELCFEGERWFDLCRNGKVEEIMNTLNSRDSGRLPLSKQYDANSYLMPIPQSALDENQNLVQNPGY